MGLEINSEIEEELSHYQFLFVGPKLKNLDLLGLVLRVALSLVTYKRR